MLCIRPCRFVRQAPGTWGASKARQSIRRQHLAIRVHMCSDRRKCTVLVYDGEGAGSRSVLSAVESLRDSLSLQVKVAFQPRCPFETRHEPKLTACSFQLQDWGCCVQVEKLGPEKLLSGTWRDDCLMLVMPGGADLPYCRQLNGRGNSLIRGVPELRLCACSRALVQSVKLS